MITRDELRSIPRLNRQIERDKEQLRYLKEKATAIASTLDIEAEKVQTSPKNIAGRYIEAAADLGTEIAEKEQELNELQDKARPFIESFNKKESRLEYKILTLRYQECQEWYVIADIVGYAERYIRQTEYDITYRLTL